jgi:hypothetical protein
MMLSDLSRQFEEASARFGGMIVAIGAPNGRWARFGGIEHVLQGDEELAVLSLGDGRFDDGATPHAAVCGWVDEFLEEHGDMKVAIFEGGVLHQHVDLNVETEIDEDGQDVAVAVIQAYVRKASPRR